MPHCSFCGKTQEQVGKFQWTLLETYLGKGATDTVTRVFCTTNCIGEWIDCQGDW